MAAPQALAGPPRDGVLVALNCADGTSGPECRHAAPERKPATPAPPRNSETQRPVPHQAPDRVPPNAAQVPPQRTIHPGQQQTPQQAPQQAQQPAQQDRHQAQKERQQEHQRRRQQEADARNQPGVPQRQVQQGSPSEAPTRLPPAGRAVDPMTAPPSAPQPRVSPPAGPSAPPAALPARPAVRQGAIRFRPCIRGVPQRACHPPALARRSRRASPRAICRIAVRRRKPVSPAGPDRPLPDRYPWRRRSRPRRRSRGPPAARPPQRQQPGSRKGPVGLRSPPPCPRPAVRLPHIRKRANRSRWMRRPPWPHAVPGALSISAARAPMALAP
jgi:hypothetical protein